MISSAYWDEEFKSGRNFWRLSTVQLNKLLRHLPKRGSVLEVGFWRGDLLTELHRRGYLVYGIERSVKAVIAGSATMPWAETVYGDFSSMTEQEIGHYDILFMKLVFAFLPDRLRILAKCRRVASHVVIITPVFDPYAQPAPTDHERSIGIPITEIESIRLQYPTIMQHSLCQTPRIDVLLMH